MKTKIIYISGGEVFNVAEVRAAFEEVRDALGLSTDTILFGVPVDSENAQINQVETAVATDVEVTQDTEVIETPVKKVRKSAKKQTVDTEDKNDKVIPILSVLSGKSEPTEQPVPEIKIETVTIDTLTIQTPDIEEMAPEIVTMDTITISDIIMDETPDEIEPIETDTEQTLEQLLERMAPLREDRESEEIVIKKQEPIIQDTSDTDATLEQLAAEFAVTQDKIVDSPKTENNGKIGKLKNILPFKKAKRDDTGLMGDLFGWAGIAANDEEFSMPGFFTTATKK